MGALDRFQRTALLTTATTYLLIAVGGLVRAAGAGLGCPDWPQCFGLWIPPLSVEGLPPGFDPADFNVFKTWTEYLNRLLGALTGLLILATALMALLDHRRTPRVLIPTLAAFVLVVFNGWLGGMVVRSQLAPLVLTAHLVFALLVVSLLLYATVNAFFPRGPVALVEPDRRLLGHLVVALLALVLAQIGLGAFLRGEVQEVAAAGVPRDAWLAQVGLVETLHRSFAVVVGAAVLAVLGWVQKREGDSLMSRAATLAAVLVILQVASGLGLAYLDFPRLLQVVHLWASALLLGVLTVVAMLVWRLDPRLSVEVAKRRRLAP